MTTRDEYIASAKKLRETFEARAANILKDHECIALANTPDVQVWRCKAPKATAYAFDITITRFGIAVMGDIDSLVFNVGMGYGLPFLAGDDVGYYIHSKLEHGFKDRQLGQDRFRGGIIAGVCELLTSNADDEAYDALPEWVREEDARGPEGSRWLDLRLLIDSRDHLAEDAGHDWHEVSALLAEAQRIDDLDEANHFRSEHHEALGLGDDWWDYDVGEACDNLIERLYMVRHAARAILAQQGEGGEA